MCVRAILILSFGSRAKPVTTEANGNPFAAVRLKAPQAPRDNSTSSFSFSSSSSTESKMMGAKTKERMERMNKSFSETCAKALEKDPAHDLSYTISEFFAWKRVIMQNRQEPGKEVVGTNTKTSSGGSDGNSTTKLLFGVSPPSTNPFGGAPPTSNTKNPFGNFASAPSPAATPGFSFKIPSKTTTTTSPAQPTPPAGNGDDAMPKMAPEKVEKSEDADWTIVREVRAKYYRNDNGAWKGLATGLLRLEGHKKDESNRMVMRDGSGKLQLNLSVTKGMPIMEQTSAKGKTFILFVAVQDENKGPQQFKLQVKPADFSETLGVLKGMAE